MERRSAPVCANPLFELAGRSAVFTSRSSAPGVSITALSLARCFPGYYGYYGYPTYYGGDFYSTPDYYPGYDYYGSSYSAPAYSAQNDIAQQQDIDRLEDEVARLREQRETQQPAPESPGAQTESPAEPTVLVFRDKHTQEVQNYAIVGGTLWIFSEQRATKLPLSWLDIEATTKANDDRGVNFQVPR